MMQASDVAAVEKRVFQKLLNLLIRVALIMALVWKCYTIFAPFVSLMLWALILAVNMFPLHQGLARRLGDRQGWASTVLVTLGIILFVIPTGLLMNILGDNVSALIEGVRNNTLAIPSPAPSVADWPLVGKKIYPVWKMASTDLPGFIASLQPKIGDVARQALSVVPPDG